MCTTPGTMLNPDLSHALISYSVYIPLCVILALLPTLPLPCLPVHLTHRRLMQFCKVQTTRRTASSRPENHQVHGQMRSKSPRSTGSTRWILLTQMERVPSFSDTCSVLRTILSSRYPNFIFTMQFSAIVQNSSKWAWWWYPWMVSDMHENWHGGYHGN